MLIYRIRPGLLVPHLALPLVTGQRAPICQRAIGKLGLAGPTGRQARNTSRVGRDLGHLRP